MILKFAGEMKIRRKKNTSEAAWEGDHQLRASLQFFLYAQTCQNFLRAFFPWTFFF